jgi:hypothetical protein
MDLADLPPDVYYLSRITATDCSGVLYVILTINILYSFATTGFRFYLRKGKYSSDDWTAALSTVLHTRILPIGFIFTDL